MSVAAAPEASGGSTAAAAANGATSGRWLGLDALRGLAIAAMILVNNPGSWRDGYQYAPLRHADWHGVTFTDLVFPTFLFCAGVAIVPALGRRVARGDDRMALLRSVARRSLLLVLVGLLLQSFPFVSFAADRPLFAPVLDARWPGVLQRIGVAYGLGAVVFLTFGERTHRWLCWALLLGYWALITLVPVPGVGWPDLDDPARTLQGYVDRLVFGRHVLRGGTFDPEGLLSTIPAVATVLFGVACGRLMVQRTNVDDRVRGLLLYGAAWLALGSVWDWFLSCNKALWTSSYAVFTAGVAALGLGLCVHAFERLGLRRLAFPLEVYGVNALLVFVGSGVLGRIVGSLWRVESNGQSVPVQAWFFRTVLEPLAPPRLASLTFALLWVFGWYLVLLWLYRRRIVWKV